MVTPEKIMQKYNQFTKKSAFTVRFDFSEKEIAQDMLCILMERLKLNAAQAISSAITEERCTQIVKTGWASLAYTHWGHAEYYTKVWKKLDNPIIDVSLTFEQLTEIEWISFTENTDTTTALCYFLTFALGDLGYHL